MALHKALAECFHGGSLRKPGDVFDYNGPEVAYLEKLAAPKTASGAKTTGAPKPGAAGGDGKEPLA
ncbi:hypothetical protein [Dongia sp.]|jgi:hypothetical protein|uniref:hypothetical protein n=1 Tax=Dongia sp. TaxID=1977262 RepID=UPI0035B0A345